LNKSGNLTLFIHTTNNKIYKINPEIRITRNYNRFKGLIGKLLIDGNINALSSITIKFENPVYPNDEIIFNGKIIDIKHEDNRKIVHCEYHVEKIDNERVMTGTVNLSFSK